MARSFFSEPPTVSAVRKRRNEPERKSVIRVFRESLGLSARVFWENIGVSESVGYQFENGRPMPPTVKKLFYIMYTAVGVPDEVKEKIKQCK